MWAEMKTSCRSGRSPSRSVRSPVASQLRRRCRAGHPQLSGRLHEDPYPGAGLQPQWTVPQGIEEIWKDALNRGMTIEDFEGLATSGCNGSAGRSGPTQLADLRTRPVVYSCRTSC